MNKILILFSFSLLLITSVTAQTDLTSDELNLKNIEENGYGFEQVVSITGDALFAPTWTSTIDAPEPFGRSVGGQIGDFVYVFTGQANNSMAAAYNISANTWSTSTVCTDPSYNSAFCVTGSELYKLSGSAAISTFEKFTPDGSGTGTWTVLTAGPSNVMNAQNTIAWDGGDYIYAHSSGYTSPYTSYLSRYSISGNTWVNLTPTTLIKRYAGLEVHNGYLYLIGGLIPDGDDPTACAKYNISTDTWSSIASLPEGLNFCKWTTTLVNDYIVIVGSGGGYGTYPSSPKIFYYNTNDDTWTYDSDVPAERGLALGFFMSSQNKIFFGGGNTGGSTNYQVNCWTAEGGFIPVELVSFSALADANSVTLSWITSTETNNSHFDIQRSADGVGFEKIGTVDGYGTTTETHHYSFEDAGLSAGSYYYRLKQIDFNGSFEFSEIIEAQIITPDDFELLQNYPNPFNPSTTISFNIPVKELVSLKIYDLMGKEIANLVNEEKEAGSYSIGFDASNISSGAYFYKLQAGNKIETRKMLLLK